MLALSLSTPDDEVTSAVQGPDEILRFRQSERHLHWAVAVPFKVCYATALVLVVVYNPHPMRPLREVVSWIHRTSGICLAVLPMLTIAWHRRDYAIHLNNIKRAWSWRLSDLKWLLLMGPAAVSPRISLPHQDKFNAAEKINFMVLTCTYPVYIVTGLTIWFLGPAFVSWLVHFSLAAAATPLIFGHIFMATVNPDTRVGLKGMFSGFVDRNWAKHHYRLWYDELFGESESAEAAARAAEPAQQPADTGTPTLPPAPAVVPPRPVAPAWQPMAAVAPSRQPVVAARPAAQAAAAVSSRDEERDTEWILRPSTVPADETGAVAWTLRPIKRDAPRRPAAKGSADPSFAS